MVSKGYDPVQITAMIRSINLGRTLQTEIGQELEQFYRSGRSLSEAVKEFELESKYGVTFDVARIAVQRALSGHTSDSLGVETYVGLISDNAERERLAREHNTEQGRKKYENSEGIHRLSSEEKRNAGLKGGSIGGLKGGRITYELKKGIHGRSQEQRVKDAHTAGPIGGKASALARGFVPWTNEEIKTAYELGNQPEYQHNQGSSRPGLPVNAKIALQLNTMYHQGNPIRNAKAVATKRYWYGSSLEDKVNPN